MNTPARTVGLDCPYHVRTAEGVFHSGHDSEVQAISRAQIANNKAEVLGIQTRYVVTNNPEGSE